MEGNKQKSRQGKAAGGGKDRGQGVSSDGQSDSGGPREEGKNPAPSQAPRGVRGGDGAVGNSCTLQVRQLSVALFSHFFFYLN